MYTLQHPRGRHEYKWSAGVPSSSKLYTAWLQAEPNCGEGRRSCSLCWFFVVVWDNNWSCLSVQLGTSWRRTMKWTWWVWVDIARWPDAISWITFPSLARSVIKCSGKSLIFYVFFLLRLLARPSSSHGHKPAPPNISKVRPDQINLLLLGLLLSKNGPTDRKKNTYKSGTVLHFQKKVYISTKYIYKCTHKGEPFHTFKGKIFPTKTSAYAQMHTLKMERYMYKCTPRYWIKWKNSEA